MNHSSRQKDGIGRMKWFTENWWKMVVALTWFGAVGYVYGIWTDDESLMFLSAYLLSGCVVVLGYIEI